MASGARGQSTGAVAMASGPYVITPALRKAGYIVRDMYLSRYLSRRVGAVFTGAPTVKRGVVLDGATQFVKYTDPRWLQAFALSPHFWTVDLTPGFAADDNNEHVILDMEDVGGGGETVYGIRKLGAQSQNALRVTLPGSDIDIGYSSYQALWASGQRMRITVNVGKTGGTETLIGSTQVDQSSVLFAAQGTDNVYVGVDNDESSGFFSGTIHSFAFGRGSLTAAEAAGIPSD